MIPAKYDSTFQEKVDHWLTPLGWPDWRIVKAQCWQESRFNNLAESPVGARGMMQIMPDTWTEWSPRAGYDKPPPWTYPVQNIDIGCCYMAWLWNQWKSPRPTLDRVQLTLASYNSGLGHVLKAQELSGGKVLYDEIAAFIPQANPKGTKENLDYVKIILTLYETMIQLEAQQ